MPDPNLSSVAATDLVHVQSNGTEYLAAVQLFVNQANSGTWAGTPIAATYLASTAVTAGSYLSPNLTIDAQGRVTAALGGVAVGRLTSTVTTTSNVQGTNVLTGLSFAVAASEIWSVEFHLVCTGSTGGLKFQLTGPATGSPVLSIATFGDTTGAGTYADDQQTAFSTPSQAYGANVTPFTGIVRIVACIANGTTAGTVALTFASTTNTQSNSVLANSYMTARRIV